MLTVDIGLELGLELENALNRMDFFRLFKALAVKYGCDYFALMELPFEDGKVALQKGHWLNNFPDSFSLEADGGICTSDPIAHHLSSCTAACVYDADHAQSKLFDKSGCKSAIVISLHSAAGKRFGLVLLSKSKMEKCNNLAVIAYYASIIFQRYYEVILSLDSMSALNDREIQIIRWTSEGKTSSDIAIILGLSEHTVNSYVAAILRKLHVVNRAQMVASALRTGLIH